AIDQVLARLPADERAFETIGVLVIPSMATTKEAGILGDEFCLLKVSLRKDSPPHLVIDPTKRDFRETTGEKLFLEIGPEPKLPFRKGTVSIQTGALTGNLTQQTKVSKFHMGNVASACVQMKL